MSSTSAYVPPHRRSQPCTTEPAVVGGSASSASPFPHDEQALPPGQDGDWKYVPRGQARPKEYDTLSTVSSVPTSAVPLRPTKHFVARQQLRDIDDHEVQTARKHPFVAYEEVDRRCWQILGNRVELVTAGPHREDLNITVYRTPSRFRWTTVCSDKEVGFSPVLLSSFTQDTMAMMRVDKAAGSLMFGIGLDHKHLNQQNDGMEPMFNFSLACVQLTTSPVLSAASHLAHVLIPRKPYKAHIPHAVQVSADEHDNLRHVLTVDGMDWLEDEQDAANPSAAAAKVSETCQLIRDLMLHIEASSSHLHKLFPGCLTGIWEQRKNSDKTYHKSQHDSKIILLHSPAHATLTSQPMTEGVTVAGKHDDSNLAAAKPASSDLPQDMQPAHDDLFWFLNMSMNDSWAAAGVGHTLASKNGCPTEVFINALQVVGGHAGSPATRSLCVVEYTEDGSVKCMRKGADDHNPWIKVSTYATPTPPVESENHLPSATDSVTHSMNSHGSVPSSLTRQHADLDGTHAVHGSAGAPISYAADVLDVAAALNGMQGICKAAIIGDDDFIRRMDSTERAAVINKPGLGLDLPPLLLAAKYGKLQCVQALHEAGADVSVRRRGYGSTALAYAVAYDQWEVVEYLICEGQADVDERTLQIIQDNDSKKTHLRSIVQMSPFYGTLPTRVLRSLDLV